MPTSKRERNIGVSIEIPEPFGGMLVATRESVGDPQAQKVPAHVTLLPPTLVNEADLPGVEDHLTRVAAAQPAFTMLLRGTGTFRPISQVVFVVVAMGIAECEQLESKVRSGVLAQDLRFNYHPHVTIAHDLEPEDLDRAFNTMSDFEASFEVTRFNLYHCDEDGIWRAIRQFYLG